MVRIGTKVDANVKASAHAEFTCLHDYVKLWTLDIVKILQSAQRFRDTVALLAARNLMVDLRVRGHLGFRRLLRIDPAALNAT